MKIKRLATIGALALVVAAGTGGAIAATRADEGKKIEDSILSNAAKRLGVSPSELRDALAAAQDAQIDQAVKDGRLTEEQAERLKKRRAESGRVLGFPGGPGHHFRGGPGGPGMRGGPLLGDVATALGIKRAELIEQLRDGKTVAEIAKAEGKSLADVKKSVRAAAEKRLDAAVKDGRITRSQADAMLDHIEEHVERLGTKGPRFHKRGEGGPPPGFGGPPPEERGSSDPSAAPVPAPEGAVF